MQQLKDNPPVRQRSDMDEEERRARRAEVRLKLAERELLSQRLEEQRRLVSDIEGKLDEIAAEHRVAMAPTQAELDKIDAKLIADIKDRKPQDEKLAARRAALMIETTEAVEKLESTLEVQRALLRRARSEEIRIGRELGELPIESDLVRLGRPDLLLAMRIAGRTSELAQRRLDAANDPTKNRGPADYVAAEIREAERLLGEAVERAEAAYRTVIDE